MSAAPEQGYMTCPLCQNETCKEHCEATGCKWLKCADPNCDGLIDLSLAIGHCLDPQKEAVNGIRPRMRVEFKGGEWRERLHG